jgi:plasmid segregation protein ParM
MSDNLERYLNGGDIPVGVDDGYDEVKIVLPDGSSLRIPSHAKSGKDNLISFGDEEKTVFSYKANGKEFMAGQILEHDNTASDDYPVSDLNRVIVMHALRQAGLTEKHNLSICTGLPLKKYYRLNKPNKELINAKVSNLTKNDVESDDEYLLPKVKSHQVLAEGLAAWFDYITYRNKDGSIGRNAELYGQRIAIIDIGGRTTDIAVIHKGQLEYSRSSTIEAGMLNVKDEVKELVRDEFEVEINNEQMHCAIHEGRIKAWGEWKNVEHIVKIAEEVVSDRIRSEAKRRLKNAADIDVVLFVGGTVNKMHDLILGWFRNQIIVEDPEFANARGMQKYVQLFLDNKAK